jgi:hypothetical protein
MMNTANKFLLMSTLLVPLACVGADRCPLPVRPIASVHEAMALAKRFTVAYKLSSVTVACLEFKPSKQYSGTGYEIVIREVHSKECGGDEMTSPRVANLNITPNGYVTTDVYSVETGTYRRLACKKEMKSRATR